MKLILKGSLTEQVFDPTISLSNIGNSQQETLRRLHQKYWVMCDCVSNSPPIMTVRKVGDQFYLVNLPGYGKHSAECQHHYIPINKSTPIDEASFNFKTQPGVELAKIECDLQLSSIRKLLFYLIEKGGLNLIQNGHTFSSNINAIVKTSTTNVHVNGVPIEKRVRFGLEQFNHVKKIITSEIELGRHTSPFFIVDVIDEINFNDKSILTLKRIKGKERYKFNFHHSLTAISPPKLDKGPFLLLTSITQVESRGRSVIAPTVCCFLPIANKLSWVPVNTNLEKMVVEKILSSIKWYKDKLDLNFTCEKLLKPVINELGRSYPPFKFSLDNQYAYFDTHLKSDTTKNAQRMLDYVVLSKLAGGAYCVIDDHLDEKDILNELFHVVREVLKTLKQSSDELPAFNKQMVQITY